MARVLIIGEQHDGPALVARGHDHMFKRIPRIAFGIDNDHVGLQLRQPLAQKGVGRQRGDQVETAFQQANAQLARTFRQRHAGLIPVIGNDQIRLDDDQAQGMWRIHGKN